MNKMKCKKEMRVVFGILFVFGMILTVGKGTLDSVYGQINSTINQTNTPSTTNTNTTNTNTTNTNTTNTASPAITTSAEEEASESIKGAITETGSLLRNITEKVATSKSAGAILNETSEVLGNAYIEAKKFLSPN
jgi:predicted PurR-regulated permease PerM